MSKFESDAIVIKNVVKQFGDFKALNNISIEIKDNEFFTLLGPSGCGKTTLLRLIAGFEDATAGSITLFGEEIDKLPPNKRPVNTVFQNYALFPHMTVLENVSFGLEMLGTSKSETAIRANQMLELVQLDQFASRKPSQLSGGQQQRVALARALAPQPKVLLLDEPLSALDLKLRKAMQIELKHLQRETGITFIFVTHDQEEALTMSDRVAVMSAGELQQVGLARKIYEEPRNKFVANFIGETNLLEVKINQVTEDRAFCQITERHSLACRKIGGINSGDLVHLSIRPERLSLTNEPVDKESIEGEVLETIFIGTDVSVLAKLLNGPQISVRLQNSKNVNDCSLESGSRIYVNFEKDAVQLLVD